MESIKRILVIADPTAQQSAALKKARQIAVNFRAKVDILCCVANPTLTRSFFPDEISQENTIRPVRNKYLEQMQVLAEPFRADNLSVTCHVEFGNPLHAIMEDYIVLTRPDLVVKDTHHHSLIRRTLLSNTDFHLIRACQSPLLLVKEQSWSETPHVAAAVDPGHPQDTPALLDHAVIYAAERIARGFGTQPSLIHCWSPMGLYAAGATGGGMGGVAMLMPQEVIDAQRTLDRERFEHLARVHDIPQHRTHLREGIAIDELPVYAKHGAIDILAMGAVSRSGLDRIFIGHTAEALLDVMPCDILIIKASPKIHV